MNSKPKKESKKEQKALGTDSVKKENADSDEELWKQASQIAADEEPKSEDENMEDTEPDTPSFDDMPSPVVQALIEQLEQDNDTPMIPDYSYADRDNAEEEDAEADHAEEGDTIEERDSNRASNAEEPKDESGTPVVRSKVPGENTFSHECVKTWSPARIHAWEIRRLVCREPQSKKERDRMCVSAYTAHTHAAVPSLTSIYHRTQKLSITVS